MTASPDAAPIRAYLLDLQDRICAALEREDGAARFREQRFEAPSGALARPRVLEGGPVIEKSAVHFSHTRGQQLPAAATERRPELAGRAYEAVSVSLIVHPRNPYVPTSHMNVRFFTTTHPPSEAPTHSSAQGGRPASGAAGLAGRGARSEPKASEAIRPPAHQQIHPNDGLEGHRSDPSAHSKPSPSPSSSSSSSPTWWFGGGFDLTPCYGFDEDCIHWHRTARDACAPLGPDAHARFKKWCDEYFFLPHRGEPRGIGGLFFDDLAEPDFATCLAFWKSVAEHYLPAYLPIVARRKGTPHGERERDFQLYRRGRYAEFNLVYDRGTRFGLQSGGRVESILASMPPLAAWRYDWRPEPGTPEAALVERYLAPRDWLA